MYLGWFIIILNVMNLYLVNMDDVLLFIMIFYNILYKKWVLYVFKLFGVFSFFNVILLFLEKGWDLFKVKFLWEKEREY